MTATIRIPAKRGRIRVAPKEERTFMGRVYHSKAEAHYAARLDLERKAGKIHAWDSQRPLPIIVAGVHICTVLVDFAVVDKSGTRFIEVKGHETEVYKLKKKLLLACYPGIRYEVVKA